MVAQQPRHQQDRQLPHSTYPNSTVRPPIRRCGRTNVRFSSAASTIPVAGRRSRRCQHVDTVGRLPKQLGGFARLTWLPAVCSASNGMPMWFDKPPRGWPKSLIAFLPDRSATRCVAQSPHTSNDRKLSPKGVASAPVPRSRPLPCPILCWAVCMAAWNMLSLIDGLSVSPAGRQTPSSTRAAIVSSASAAPEPCRPHRLSPGFVQMSCAHKGGSIRSGSCGRARSLKFSLV